MSMQSCCRWSNIGYSGPGKAEIRFEERSAMSTPPRTTRRSRLAAAASAGNDDPQARTRAHDQVLDEIDRRVIKILQTDGRRPNTEIARGLHLSGTPIPKRGSEPVSPRPLKIRGIPNPPAV